MTQLRRNVVTEPLTLLREEAPGVHGEPVDVVGRARADRRQDHRRDPVRVPLGVREAEHRPPTVPVPVRERTTPSDDLDTTGQVWPNRAADRLFAVAVGSEGFGGLSAG